MLTLADRLTVCLEHAAVYEISLREVDELAGKKGSGIAQKMRASDGDYRAAYPTLSAYAAALGCDVRWLSEGEGAAPSQARVRRAVRGPLLALRAQRGRAAEDAPRRGARKTARVGA